jgi:hypothetical protein
MFYNKVDLPKELLKLRNNNISEEEIMNQVFKILDKNETERTNIKDSLKSKPSTKINNLAFDTLESKNIFHINQIKNICIKYRLRFLDSNLFKNEIPEEAISKINALEKNNNTKLSGYKIIAPSKAFNLNNYDDPLLMIPIGNDYYYLIHKWGNDLNSNRKIKYWPIKNIINYIFFCLLISIIGTLLMPTNILSKNLEYAQMIVFLFIFKSVIITIAYYFFMMGKNFNSEIWNRPFKEN